MLKKVVLALSLSASVAVSAFAEVAVIVHPENTAEITAEDVSRMFLGKASQFSDGKEVLPITQETATTTDAFNTGLLNRSSSQVASYWAKQVFTGKGSAPKQVTDDAAVISLVKDNKNAISYVDASSVTGYVKVVLTK